MNFEEYKESISIIEGLDYEDLNSLWYKIKATISHNQRLLSRIEYMLEELENKIDLDK
jgi:hypothetical protein